MSGHSHFNSIGGNPVPPVMPPAVDEINLSGQQQQAGGVNAVVQDGPQAVQNDAREQGAEILKQLDVLLLRAASSVNKAVDADALKAAQDLPSRKRSSPRSAGSMSSLSPRGV